MSADLFAAFRNPPASSSINSQPNDLCAGQPSERQTQNSARLQDTCSFTERHEVSSTSQSVPAWPSFQTSSDSMGGWAQNFPHSHPIANSSQPSNDDDDDDDDDGWGNFQAADQAMTSVATADENYRAHAPIPTTRAWVSQTVVTDQHVPKQNVARGPKKEAMVRNLLDLDPVEGESAHDPTFQSSDRAPRKKMQVKATSSDPDVLFDAEDFELQDGGEVGYDDLDDFGDFEAAEPQSNTKAEPPAASRASSASDLPSLDDPPVEIHKNNITSEISRASGGPLRFGAMPTLTKSHCIPQSPSHPSQPRPPRVFDKQLATAKPVLKASPSSIEKNAKKDSATSRIPFKGTAEDDEWAAWNDFSDINRDISVTPALNTKAVATNAEQNWDWNQGQKDVSTSVEISSSSPPPTNVPPPAILLSIFHELFSSGDFLFKPVSGQTATIKQQVVSNSKIVDFLQGYILIATTAARIIAGRKHRWHRDKMLAKKMSISAAGSKGMKLAGVDRTQSAREDREVADVITAWKEYVGRLRSAVAAANSAVKADLKVPELTESPQVQTAKMIPTAPKACIICGLKREERVTRVDFDVEDSFGEWWVDHWGHTSCQNFWIQHQEKLRQR